MRSRTRSSIAPGAALLRLFAGGLLIIVIAAPGHAALEDPTRPPATVTAPAQSTSTGVASGPRWVLTSTLVSPERRTAVINGQVVAVGDRVGGALVVEIEADSVRMRAAGREVTLTLLKTDIKRPSGAQSNKPKSATP